MPNFFINQQVDIHTLPEFLKRKNGQISIGDLHGNAIKLLFMLIKHQIITNITDEDYKKFVEIYTTPVDKLKRDQLEVFNNLLDNAKFSNNGLKLRFLGDELADRGSNDYFTLKILEKLAAAKVPFEIILSNHGVEFIHAYETKDKFEPFFLPRHAMSMQGLQKIVDKGFVSRKDIMTIVNNAYKPALKAISYSLNQAGNEITIFSHAPIGLDTIKHLSEKLNVKYKIDTAADLANTIDDINKKFQDHVKINTVHTLYTINSMKSSLGGFVDSKATPFEFIMWNKRYDCINRPNKNSSYDLCFVHGHDPNDPRGNELHIHNLDNDLGKGHNKNEGNYTILFTKTKVVSKKENKDKLPSSTPVLKNQKSIHSSTIDSLTNRQINAISKLLSDYLEHLCSYPCQIDCLNKFESTSEKNVFFKDKDDKVVDNLSIASNLDDKTRIKFNKTCDLLIKLHNNDGTFQEDIHNHDTIKLLSAHRDNLVVRMLKAIRCLLTLGCVPKWNFFSSRGAEVVEKINIFLPPRLLNR